MADRDEWPRFADYQVVDRIGAGGMGEVFLARRRGAGELCVLKRLRPEITSFPEARARFLREAEVCSLLSHPNIAKLLDARIEGDAMFLAFEHVAGRDLEAIARERARVQELPLPLPLAIEVAVSVLEGLSAAHQLKSGDGRALDVVHRDIGLRNLMISYSGEVKIIDFGLVRASMGDLRTRTGAMMGTPRFMSPEQASGERADLRSDLYAAGVVLFEMMCGRVLIQGKKPTEILHNILSTPVPKISRLVPVSTRFDAFFDVALAKLAEDRFESAAAMITALREAAQDVPRPSDPRAELAALLAPLFAEHRGRLEAMIGEAAAQRVEGAATRVMELGSELPPTVVSEPRGFGGARAIRESGSGSGSARESRPFAATRSRRGSRSRPRSSRVWMLAAAMFALSIASGAIAYVLVTEEPKAVLTVANPADRAPAEPQIAPRAVETAREPAIAAAERAEAAAAELAVTETKPRPASVARTDPKPEPRNSAKPDVRTESKPDVRTESKPDVRSGSKPDARTALPLAERDGAKPDPQPEVSAARPSADAPYADIRALLAAGDARSLVNAETKLRAAGDALSPAARNAISDCLTSATTAPNATVWRDGLNRCLDTLLREKRAAP